MRIRATAPRGKWSLRQRVASMTLKPVDDDESEDMAILLRCLVTPGGPFVLIRAAKKMLHRSQAALK